MFTFPILAVRKVIDRGITDAAANGGFRNPYYGTRPGEGEKPGLWLVSDEGVYIMSNGKLAEGARALVLYSEQCHPTGNPDWWHYKRRHFGGDDGIEFIELDEPRGQPRTFSGARTRATGSVEWSGWSPRQGVLTKGFPLHG